MPALERAPSSLELDSLVGEMVSRRAYDRFIQRGCEHGHDVEDWLEAESEVMALIDPSGIRGLRLAHELATSPRR